MRIPEIVNTILNTLRSIPIINKLIPDNRTEEEKIKGIIDSIITGDVITGIFNLFEKIIYVIYKCIPATESFKQDYIISIFNYNSRETFMRQWYAQLLNNDIPKKYASAYIIILSIKIPIWNMLLVFKSFWNTGQIKKSDETKSIDDKIHPFTAGDPINVNGNNETEMKIQEKCQKFIQISKTSINEINRRKRLTWQIIKDSITGIIPVFFVPFISLFKFGFGVSDDNFLHQYIDPVITTLIMVYYYYFLVTALVLSTLAIEKEESFNPSQDDNTDINNIKIDYEY